jgi:hypothetical protein
MMFLVELALWLILPILFGLGTGLPTLLKKAVRGLFYPALNQQMGRLQFITRLTLLGLPVAFVVSVVLGAWFREWRWGAMGMIGMAAATYGAAWCGQRVEQIVKQLQGVEQESIEVEHHE